MRKNYWAIKHDKSHSRIYHIWAGMKGRCLNEAYCQYKYYGARGVRVYDDWLDKETGFVSFYKWSMENGYSENLSIDRINSDGNYEPNNCRWATRYQQNMNLRSTRNTSGYIGVCKHSSADRWYGRVKISGICIYTGMSENIHEAALMRNNYILFHGLENKLNEVWLNV